jgi:hypothetical protein
MDKTSLNFDISFQVPIEKMTKQQVIKKQFINEKFQIEFMDFSQRRKEGFRGQPEFDNKRILLANQ